MYRGCSIAVVMPAFNVEDHVVEAVRTVPSFVDRVVVVDDGSTDRTSSLLAQVSREGLVCIRHCENRGVGAAIATGYEAALDMGAQVMAVMAGDGQMDPADLSGVLDPVVSGGFDYAKGNRFGRREVWRVMPWSRLVGNLVLSLMTKITSGYWRCFDSQCGYTAISARALRAIHGRLFARYGYPNDILARLQVVGARVTDVPVRPVYDGQPSGIKLHTVIYPISFVLIRSMARRLWLQRLRPVLSPATSARDHRLSDGERPSDRLLPAPPP